MKSIFLISFISIFSISSITAQTDSVMLRKIYDEALVNGKSYENLRYLCKKIGPRLSGSANAQKSVEWTQSIMKQYNFDKVYLQECMVPKWIRGEKEIGKIIFGKQEILMDVCALGMSPATSKNGLKASVIELKSLQELSDRAKEIPGKIVFFNRPFDPRFIEPGSAYGAAGDQRFAGPAEAAKYGAVGVIVRSLTQSLDNYPHTGTTRFPEGSKKIPAAAISTKSAEQLSAMLRQHKVGVQFYLKQSCQLLPDVKSYNVVGEITGSAYPDSFITVGGHLDSWDLAEGAHDDGTGVMQALEVLRIYKQLNIKPRHSIRAVMFMNEENGGRGGAKYAELALKNKETHIAAIESDGGGFTPRGFNFQDISEDELKLINNKWKNLLAPYLADRLLSGGGGSDIGHLSVFREIKLIGFKADAQRYFDIHHTANDVFENVNQRELELGAAAMTALVYLIDMQGFK